MKKRDERRFMNYLVKRITFSKIVDSTMKPSLAVTLTLNAKDIDVIVHREFDEEEMDYLAREMVKAFTDQCNDPKSYLNERLSEMLDVTLSDEI